MITQQPHGMFAGQDREDDHSCRYRINDLSAVHRRSCRGGPTSGYTQVPDTGCPALRDRQALTPPTSRNLAGSPSSWQMVQAQIEATTAGL